ncbi:Imm50 family immunity protein [Streptomyces sp. ODS28]|uniref:Imm50 family immunity protein n=1 Tax=Streptomyces sp. ODS28 TaxID=3136688 RepID=UPI0031F11F83
MSWVSALADATPILKVFDGSPPALHGVRVHEVTVQANGPQLLLRVDLAEFPDSPPPKWRMQGFNTVQVEINLVGARDLRLEGFGRDLVVDVELEKEELVHLSVDSPDFRLSAVADAVLLAKVSAYANA